MAQQSGFGIQDFYQTATERGFARNNLFRIKTIGEIFGSDSDLLIYAQGGMIPNRQISTSKISFKAFDFVVPMGASYPENQSWSVTFFCDSEYVLRDIFEKWSNATYDEHKNLNIGSLVDVEAVLLNNSSINDKELKEVRNYKLVGCFPVQIGPLTYIQGSAGELVGSQVNIAFQYVISNNNQ